MATFTDSFDDSVPQTESTRPFNDEYDNGDSGYDGYEAPQFSESGGVFVSEEEHQQPPIYGGGVDFATEENGGVLGGGLDDPILPPPSEMKEEGVALREWRRENAMRLEEKEKKEKEVLGRIIEEAEEYKVEFYKKREVTCENSKTTNREREKLFVANQEKFHEEADKHYWEAIAELIPNEVPAIEKKRGKKDQEKKPAVVVIQGPKPGKPTDLSRMRRILLKLKHNTPAHLKHAPAPAPAPAPTPAADGTKEDKPSDAIAPTTSPVVNVPEPVAVA